MTVKEWPVRHRDQRRDTNPSRVNQHHRPKRRRRVTNDERHNGGDQEQDLHQLLR